jgi:methionyl-tRNA formyltransferase
MMRIIFMGTPQFAATALASLSAAGHDIVCVYTQPPRAANRGKAMQKSAVHVLAEHHNFLVRTPTSLRDEKTQADFADLKADIAVVAAYGMILPQAILDAPTLGCLNIHASLLPRWRGAAPIHRCIEAGDTDTGICIMQMDAGLDTGPVLLRRAMPVSPHDTTGTLLVALGTLGAAAIVQTLAELPTLKVTPQEENAVSYARKINKLEAQLDFSQPVDVLERRIRAFNPAPGAFIEVTGERIKILQAHVISNPSVKNFMPGSIVDAQMSIMCGDGKVLQPKIVQRAGRQAVAVTEFLRGFPISIGYQL